MKLHEIKDTPSNRDLSDRIKTGKDRSSIGLDDWKKLQVRLRKRIRSGEVKRMGEGLYGVVYDMPRRVNTVVKTMRYPVPLDMLESWLVFVDEIVRSGKSNPYLPQIGSVKFYGVEPKDKDDIFNYSERDWEEYGDADAYSGQEYYNYVVEMEKLYSVAQIEREYVSSDEDSDSRDAQDAFSAQNQFAIVYKKLTGRDPEGSYAASALMQLVKRALEGRREEIVDKKFIEACELVDRAGSRNHSGFIDMNMGNFMFRRLPTGLQLVITDPLL